MTLTRQVLRDMGLTEEQIAAVIGVHEDELDALREQIGTLEGEMESLLDQKAEEAEDPENWKAKHDELKLAFDNYRSEVEGRETTAKLRAAYRALLRLENVDERYHDAILRATDLSGLELQEDGTLKDAEALRTAICADWAAFVVTRGRRGANVSMPPRRGPARMTRDEIMAIRDAGQRQKAMAENHELFGF